MSDRATDKKSQFPAEVRASDYGIGRSCQTCNAIDNSQMVQCDDCDEWHHYICVGVTQKVQNEDWRCEKCEATKKKKKSTKNPKTTKNQQKEAWAAAQQSKPVAASKPSKPASRTSSVSKESSKAASKRAKPASAMSSVSRKSSKARLELQLQKIEAERTLLDEKKKLMDKQFQILEELADLEDPEADDENDENVDGNSKVQQWLQDENLDAECFENESSSSSNEEAADVVENSFEPKKQSTPRTGKGKFTSNLSRNQIAARQVVPKELPPFNGNPEHWPMFFATYESTTRMCGLTDDENMLRLRNCLRGEALAAVQNFLLHPSTVGKAMKALKLRFGHPRYLIRVLKQKIMSLPPLRADSINKMIDFAFAVQNLSVTISACGKEEYTQDMSMVDALVEKLPASMKLEWARHSKHLRKVNIITFSDWIFDIAEDASIVADPPTIQEHLASKEIRRSTKDFVNTHGESQTSRDPSGSSKDEHRTVNRVAIAEHEPMPCIVCKGTCAFLAKCQRFLELSYDGRWAVIRETRTCRKCLKRHKGGCQSKDCGVNQCTFKHHPLLHKELQTDSSKAVVPRRDEQSCHTHRTVSSSILFRYIPVEVYGNGISVHCYAFLDDGSSLTLVDQDLADELNLSGEPRPLCLKWTGGTHRFEEDSRSVNFNISGQRGRRYSLNDVRTVKDLQLPTQTLDAEQLQTEYPYLRNIPLLSYQNVRPRLLIGVKHANATLVRKSREGEYGQPIAIKTNLGWTVYGGASAEQTMNMLHYTYHVFPCEHEIDDTLQRSMKEYFAIDSLGIMRPGKEIRSRDDERALKLLHDLTFFDGKRYETGLLWRQDDVRLPDNKQMALNRFYSLERRMKKDPDLSRVLKEKMMEYLAKGYVRKLTNDELAKVQERAWYLPVFPVTNPNKPGKIRLVWDAAASTNGVSLNSNLLAGPDLLTPLTSVLYKFREYRFAVVGDICEMFHQVRIRSEDQHSQRFLWRDSDVLKEPSVYVMEVMTFGACCSPASAQFTKNLNAERFSLQFPAAATAIIQSTYVDDMLCSLETEEAAIQLVKSVCFVHEQGGFEIRNWMTNSPTILSAVCGTATAEKSLDLSSDLATEKVLGMWWCTNTDCFTYKLNRARLGEDLLEGKRCPTKREVLRTLMSIYDPMGLIAHYMMFLKVLLQEIWRTTVDWDEKIDQSSFEKWRLWIRLLPQIEDLRIPRCYRQVLSAREETEIQLHTFVDAGENGMSAVVYLRYVEGTTVECTLVGAKTRVAPLKYLSIPRLELQAALIGARLADSIILGLSIKVKRRVFWSDSRNVLSWLRSEHRRYSQFVGARVSEIIELTNISDWRWVPTKWNVADEGTKWQCQPILSNESRWYKGPEFLRTSEADWPEIPSKMESTSEELRASVHTHFESSNVVLPAKNYSKWKRLVRVTAYVLRFANIRKTRAIGVLTSEEIRLTEEFHYRAAQRDSYREDLSILTDKSEKNIISKRSPLYKLNPFVDENGILRMRGRAVNCEYLPMEVKCPIILPRDHAVTKLIVESYHRKFHHRNNETVITEIKQRFAISCLRRVYAKVRTNCQRCKIRTALPRSPAMADLPMGRLAVFTRPFTHTGVDYFGPMEVVVGRRVEKRWGVLLTCLTVRAIHIEVASSLNTASCIMALRNFISRRGTPAVFYSDRGTNFISAERELKAALKEVDQDAMMQEVISSSTSWHFNPPASPHMGGSWERLIQTVKRTLLEFKISRRPTDEELRNALIEVEGLINARPLTHVPIEDEAAPVLTPNHWLLGTPDGSKPLTLLNDSSVALRRGWHVSQVLANRFWRRWLKDYLPDITCRSKWHQRVKPIEEGDIVLIADPDLPRNCWPKGRVIGTVNRDGQVRRVTIQTNRGVYERPAVKVAVLDVKSKEELANLEAELPN